MIRGVALLVTILILTLSASAIAAEPGVGVIKGQVVSGTEGGSSVADQDLVLKIYLNNTEAGSTVTKSDAEGRFAFDNLSTESSYSYQAWLQYQEAEYTNEWLSFGEGETTKSVEVIVYDSTTSDEAIKVAASHTIIYVEQGSLLVKEYLLFVIEGDRTYVGLKEVTADGAKETLRFCLPKEANKLQFTRGLMERCAVMTEEGFVDTMPVVPGVKEVAYSYRVDYGSGTYTFSEVMQYPPAGFDLLVQGEGVDVSSDQLTMEEPLDIKGTRFIHLSGKNLPSGIPLAIHLSGLPKADNQEVLKWTALVLIVLVSGFGFSYLLRRKRFQPVGPEDSLDRRRQRLLVEIAQLDDDFEDGKISEEVYRRMRSERKAQLVELIQRSEEESVIDN